jgi:hypothetical protein
MGRQVPTLDIDLKVEIARVQEELLFFRRDCLPAFLDGPVQDFLSDGMSDELQSHIVTLAGRLSDWRDATTRLAEFLPLGPLAEDAPVLCREEFGQFMFQEARTSFTCRGGRIVWRVELFATLDMALLYYHRSLGIPDETPVSFEESLPEVKRRLMGLEVDCPLFNCLCAVLPVLVDTDPAFVRLALDLETRRILVLADRTIEEERRAERLWLIDGYFGHVLNNALLHVLGALASNDFPLIGAYFDHPNLRGGYTHLMPHYLFAVLFKKVAVLRRLSQDHPWLWHCRAG